MATVFLMPSVLFTVALLTTVALGTTVATVASNSTRVAAQEGNGHEGKQHRNRTSEKTLHHISPVSNPNAQCVPQTVTKQPRFGTATESQQTK